MQITKLYHHKETNNSAINAGNIIDINNRISGETSTIYRKVAYLRIPIDSQADSISIKQLNFTSNFKKKLLKIGQVSSLIDQTWSYDSGNILVNYNRPWHIYSINSPIHSQVSLYRIDGEAIANEPTLSATTDLSLNPEFISHSFAIKLTGEKIIYNKVIDKTANNEAISINGDFTDMEISSELIDNKTAKNNTAEIANNIYHGLGSITLNAYPTTPRIGIPEDLLSENLLEDIPINYLWQEAGEHRDTINFESDDKIVKLFQDKISEQMNNKTNDNSVILPIIIDSDIPCLWQLDILSLDYKLKVSQFSDQNDQQKIEFDGNQTDNKMINLKLPDGDIEKVILKIDNSNQDNLLTPTDISSASSNIGIILHNESWAGVSLTAEKAGFYAGISALLNYSGNDIEVNARLMESNKGKVISQAVITLSGNGIDWKTLRFDDPILLDAKPYWLLLKAVNGQVIWLGENVSDSTSVVFKLDDSTVVHEKSIKNISLLGQFIGSRTGFDVNAINFQINFGENKVVLETVEQENVYELIFDKDISDKKLSVVQTGKGIINLSEPVIEYEINI